LGKGKKRGNKGRKDSLNIRKNRKKGVLTPEEGKKTAALKAGRGLKKGKSTRGGKQKKITGTESPKRAYLG